MSIVLAQPIFSNPIRYNSLGELLLAVVDGVVTILIPVMVLAIVWIGFKIVVGLYQGKGEKFVEARNDLLTAFLGLFIVLAANGIIAVIDNTVSNVLA